MLQCLLCPATFDDQKSFTRAWDDSRRDFFYDEWAQRAHSAEQNRWQQLQVRVGPCGEIDVLVGHICPNCATVEALNRLKLTKADEPVNQMGPKEARLLAWMTATDVAPTALHSVKVLDPGVNYVTRPTEGAGDPVKAMIDRLQAIERIAAT